MTIANLLGALEGPELLIILALVLLLFGGKKLPELARSLGHAKKEFQDGVGSPTGETVVPVNDAAVEETVTVPKSELDRLRKAAYERAE